MFTADDVLSKLGLQTRMTAGDYLFPALGVFGMGMLVGAGVALMVAPKSGASLRQDIGRKAMDIGRKVKSRIPMRGNGHTHTTSFASEFDDDLESMSRQQLYERASDLDIDRRAEMTKSELIEAIRSH